MKETSSRRSQSPGADHPVSHSDDGHLTEAQKNFATVLGTLLAAQWANEHEPGCDKPDRRQARERVKNGQLPRPQL